MSDSTQHRGGQDRERINVNEEYELRHWSKRFGVTADQLRRAVASAGDRADDVERHLKSQATHGGGGRGSSGSSGSGNERPR